MAELYLENGEKAGMKAVAEWWLEHYEGIEHLTAQAKQELSKLVEEIIGEAKPCEPNCSEVRHAWHEAEYQLILEQRQRAKRLGLLSKGENNGK